MIIIIRYYQIVLLLFSLLFDSLYYKIYLIAKETFFQTGKKLDQDV